MTPEQLKGVDKSKLSASQIAALQTVLHMTKGEWQRIKDTMDRDKETENREAGVADQTVKLVIEYIE